VASGSNHIVLHHDSDFDTIARAREWAGKRGPFRSPWGMFEFVSDRHVLKDLLIMSPHPEYFDGSFFLKHLIDQTVLDVDAPRESAVKIAD
jgi:hypothetical protein